MNSNSLLFPGKLRRGKKLFQPLFFVGLFLLSGSIKAQPGGSQPPAFASTDVYSGNKVNFKYYSHSVKDVTIKAEKLFK